MRLIHSVIVVNDTYQSCSPKRNLQFLVAHGTGVLKVNGREASINEDSIFTALAEIGFRMQANSKMTLHMFEWI